MAGTVTGAIGIGDVATAAAPRGTGIVIVAIGAGTATVIVTAIATVTVTAVRRNRSRAAAWSPSRTSLRVGSSEAGGFATYFVIRSSYYEVRDTSTDPIGPRSCRGPYSYRHLDPLGFEYLDQIGFTLRQGDKRVLRKS